MVAERREPPGTEEGWYALHDLRRIDWDAWRDAPERERNRAIGEGIEYLDSHVALEDATEGGSAVFSMVGHKADLMILHLRPTLEHLDRAERRFEATALAAFTERADSYVSVTEVSGYMHEDLTDGLEDIEDAGMRNYMKQRIYPEIPDADHVCFYPMDKRRDPGYNWYDLSFEERAEHMSAHGDVGRKYAGKVTQIITGSVGLDDHEWGVTLFADDPTAIKRLLYEMRFDPSSSKFAEFGAFYVGRRFPPSDLDAVFAGEAVPTEEPLAGEAESGGGGERSAADETTGKAPPSRSSGADYEEIDREEFTDRATAVGVDLDDHPDAGYGLLFRSTAAAGLREAVDDLREGFENYDSHASTTVHVDSGARAIVSLWANEQAATTASGFLSELPEIVEGVGAALEDQGDSREGASDEAVGEDADSEGHSHSGGRPNSGEPSHEEIDPEEFQHRVRRFGIDLDDYSEAGYGLCFRSSTAAEDLVDEVDGLRENFEHYDSHVLTAVRADSGDTAVVSLWANERAATTASGFLGDLSGTEAGVGTSLSAELVDEPGGTDDERIRDELADLDIYAGQPHGEDVYAMVLYSEADTEALFEEFDGLRDRFQEYDSHTRSAVYEVEDGDRSAVVSVWETEEAADRAGEYLADLPGIVERAGEESNFGTMGMFYTVRPDHRSDFIRTFKEVGNTLEGMEGHLDTRLFVNVEDENDTFIASQWREKEDAMAFFRSEDFRETVQWGREILADRPRHVFLA